MVSPRFSDAEHDINCRRPYWLDFSHCPVLGGPHGVLLSCPKPIDPTALLPLALDFKPPAAAAGALRRLSTACALGACGACRRLRRQLLQGRRDQTPTPLIWRSEIASGAEAPLSARGASGVQRQLSGVFKRYDPAHPLPRCAGTAFNRL